MIDVSRVLLLSPRFRQAPANTDHVADELIEGVTSPTLVVTRFVLSTQLADVQFHC